MDDLLEFLDHASDRGLMPVATAQALAVASRNVLGVLTEDERRNLAGQDVDAVIKRFNNKRARDFSPSSLKEYGRRVHRAIDLFLQWRNDPPNFTVKTRGTTAARKKGKAAEISSEPPGPAHIAADIADRTGTYQSSFPVRPGAVVTVVNLPIDLTKAEAQRLADFIRMLAVES
jgi:hypothetical protein